MQELVKDQIQLVSFNELINVGSYVQRIGGWRVDRRGLTYYKGKAYISITTYPYLRIIMNDGTTDRLLIGEEGE